MSSSILFTMLLKILTFSFAGVHSSSNMYDGQLKGRSDATPTCCSFEITPILNFSCMKSQKGAVDLFSPKPD